ncbi:HNH endonuclease [Capnocytophaga sp. oral taxon 903]|uniref:HNH endonuclease n=1 Tax=Capnocytophaga sp. oral taxon 903 TaxID=2748317 RepID=UPI0015BD68F3|nr:HNH endonuclease [Capnocytophaga sp. oral taxon 903]NWO28817.1 HNH endonuclease [Capnocytophaga sp. oral taxon 903]
MEYIEFENEFKAFMKKEGLKAHYISWLRFIAKEGIRIGRNMDDNNTIINHLEKNKSKRSIYLNENNNDYSDFKAALNKYRKFIAEKSDLIDDIETIIKDEIIPKTEKEQLISARIGQGNYRNKLINLWKKCAVSKCEMTELLIASHIKPWRKSTNIEKLDSYNGLLLLPNYDKLFDKGLISFEDNGKIIISPLIKEEEYKVLGISPNDRLFKVYPKNKPYLEEHRRIVFHQE